MVSNDLLKEQVKLAQEELKSSNIKMTVDRDSLYQKKVISSISYKRAGREVSDLLIYKPEVRGFGAAGKSEEEIKFSDFTPKETIYVSMAEIGPHCVVNVHNAIVLYGQAISMPHKDDEAPTYVPQEHTFFMVRPKESCLQFLTGIEALTLVDGKFYDSTGVDVCEDEVDEFTKTKILIKLQEFSYLEMTPCRLYPHFGRINIGVPIEHLLDKKIKNQPVNGIMADPLRKII